MVKNWENLGHNFFSFWARIQSCLVEKGMKWDTCWKKIIVQWFFAVLYFSFSKTYPLSFHSSLKWRQGIVKILIFNMQLFQDLEQDLWNCLLLQLPAVSQIDSKFPRAILVKGWSFDTGFDVANDLIAFFGVVTSKKLIHVFKIVKDLSKKNWCIT